MKDSSVKRYCFVIELKDEHIAEYVELHKNPWPMMLETLKKWGAKEELIYIYKNLSIVFFECDNIEELYRKLAEENVVKEWDKVTKAWFKSEFIFLQKIFDLNQQLNGKLEQY